MPKGDCAACAHYRTVWQGPALPPCGALEAKSINAARTRCAGRLFTPIAGEVGT